MIGKNSMTEMVYLRLPESHKIHDHDLLSTSYKVNSGITHLNKQEFKTDANLTSSTGKNSNSGRIMIVDDEHEIARLFAIILQDNGFVVDVFNNPLYALSNYKAGFYDLLLLDIKMPHMDGFKLYQNIKNKDNEAKVCFITAHEEFLNDFRRLFPHLQEVDCFIRKPVEMDNLVKIVKSKIDYN
jgi:CheY-like chemotaxis protein